MLTYSFELKSSIRKGFLYAQRLGASNQQFKPVRGAVAYYLPLLTVSQSDKYFEILYEQYVTSRIFV